MVALIALSIRSWHACAVRFALPLRVYCVITQFPSERRPAALVLNLLAEAPRFCAQGSSWGPSYALDWLPNRSQRLHCASLTLPYLSGRSGSAIVIADRCDRAIISSLLSYNGWPKKRNSQFSGLCSDQQLFFSPCWIEHLFLIIITLRL